MQKLTEQTKLSVKKPELAAQWSEKNFPLTPDTVSFGSHKKVIWKGTCGHEWEAQIKNRVSKDSGCPYCSGNKVLSGFNDLASRHPELAQEWSDKNLPLKASEVAEFSNIKAWWKCKTCGNEWNTLISTRSGGSECPYCSGYTLLKGFNDFASKYPELAEEWSDKNLPLTPDSISEKSRENVWWKCKKCGGEWQSVVYSRIHKTKCPYCSNSKTLKKYNDLLTTHPEVKEEWLYTLNDGDPSDYMSTSLEPVWWKCKYGHYYKSKIQNHINGEGCYYCEQEYNNAFPLLASMYYGYKNNCKVLINSNSLGGCVADINIPKERLLIDLHRDTETREIIKKQACVNKNYHYYVIETQTDIQYVEAFIHVLNSLHIYWNIDITDIARIRQGFFKLKESQKEQKSQI